MGSISEIEKLALERKGELLANPLKIVQRIINSKLMALDQSDRLLDSSAGKLSANSALFV